MSFLFRVLWLSVVLLGSDDLLVIGADPGASVGLSKKWYRDGEETLRAFEPLSAKARHSVVKIDANGVTVALGTVVDAEGLVATKASQVQDGKLTCWLAGGKEVNAELLVSDVRNDVALVRVQAQGLQPVRWVAERPSIGQWAVSPGIESLPQTAGIVSAAPRRIYPPRAFAGVELDSDETQARIARVMPGLGAEKAGIQAGDVIVAVQGATVKARTELSAKLRPFQEGQSVRLKLRRGDQEMELTVEMMVPHLSWPARGADRQDRMNRFGSELSDRAEGFDSVIQHDSVLQGWQCGGPLVALDGRAIGLNIARAGRVSSYALPASLAQKVIAELKQRLSRERAVSPRK